MEFHTGGSIASTDNFIKDISDLKMLEAKLGLVII
jgi:hypothetical protein